MTIVLGYLPCPQQCATVLHLIGINIELWKRSIFLSVCFIHGSTRIFFPLSTIVALPILLAFLHMFLLLWYVCGVLEWIHIVFHYPSYYVRFLFVPTFHNLPRPMERGGRSPLNPRGSETIPCLTQSVLSRTGILALPSVWSFRVSLVTSCYRYWIQSVCHRYLYYFK